MKLGVSHHALVDGALNAEKPLVFVMGNRKDDDEQGSKKRKHDGSNRKGNSVSIKNFGAYVQPTKIKSSTKLVIGWRVRRLITCCFTPPG